MLEKAHALRQQGQFAEAEKIYLELLRQQPQNVNAWHGLGVMTMEAGWPDRALTLLDKAYMLAPHHPGIQHAIGRGLHMLGRPAEALPHYERALAAAPELMAAHRDRAIALRELGELEAALTASDHAILLDPASFEAHNNRGMVLAAQQRHQGALASFAEATRLHPDFVEAHNNLGLALLELDRPYDALVSLDQALALAPDFAVAHSSRGSVMGKLQRHRDSLESFNQALALAPGNAEHHYSRANALLHLRRYEEALASFDAAIALRPDFENAMNNRMLALSRLGRLEECVAACDALIAADPAMPMAYANRGAALHEMGRFEDAAANYALGVAHIPDFQSRADFGNSTLTLQQGRMEAGWPLYEQRAEPGAINGIRDYPQPVWLGAESLEGKTLYVYAEQGLGDIIQFLRYLALAKARGAHVIFSSHLPMIRLCRSFDPDLEILPFATAPEEFDFHARLVSLPLAFGTRLDSIPAQVPYLRPEPEHVEKWRARIGTEGFKIGVKWTSSPHVNLGPERSFALRLLEPLARIAGVRLISLHKGDGAEELADLPPGMTVETLGADFDDGPDAFIDTAAAMESLDLVISCDTAIAHLAGALARPVWLALKHVPEWRWQLGRSDSPWYPTMTLFRQPVMGDWAGVFEQMAQRLKADLAQ